MLKAMRVLCVGLMLVALAGCAREGKRVDPDVEAVATHEFNPTDLRLLDAAVAELIAMNVLPQEPRPFMYVKVRNRTDEHIGTDLLVERISAKLSATGKVRLTGYPKELEEALRQIEFQQGAFVNPETARKAGKIHGAAFFLQGELGNLSVAAGRKKGQFFQFTLKLVDIETVEILGTSMVEISKVSKKGLFGW